MKGLPKDETADFEGGVYLWNGGTGERWAAWRPHDRPTTAAGPWLETAR